MSDDENEFEHRHLQFETMEEAIDHQRMHMQRNAHETLEALDTMDETQLKTVRGMLVAVLENTHVNGYFSGIVSSMLHEKFGICRGCGVNHDEVPTSWSKVVSDAMEGSKEPTDTERAASMEEYGVEPIEVQGSPETVKCVGCGFISVSLDDRMLRPPGVRGCEGCQHKAKFG